MRATLARTYHLKRLGKCGYPYITHMLCYEAGFIEPQSKSLNSSLTLHIPKDGKFATYATVEVILKRALNYYNTYYLSVYPTLEGFSWGMLVFDDDSRSISDRN